MSDATIFVLVFGGLFVFRALAATVVFFWILPQGDSCPNCDRATLRVEPRGFDRLMPWLRNSWCIGCGWEGMLRFADAPAAPPRLPAPPAGVRAARRGPVA